MDIVEQTYHCQIYSSLVNLLQIYTAESNFQNTVSEKNLFENHLDPFK